MKVSNTSTFLTWSDASSSLELNSTACSGISVVQTTSLSDSPGSYECGPNEPDVLSSHMNAKAPLWTRPSVPTNLPFMNRMSVWNV